MVTGACAHVPLTREMLDAEGLVADPAARTAITNMLRVLLTERGSGGS